MRHVILILAIATVVRADDSDPRFRRAVERAEERRAEKLEKAGEDLLDHFDSTIAALRRDRRVNAAVRLKVIEALEAERKTFEEHRTIPFSPLLRRAAGEYLVALRTADAELAEVYDSAIADALRSRDDETAKAIGEERAEKLVPTVVGAWKWKTKPTVWRLSIDGLVNGKSATRWTLTAEHLVIKGKQFTNECTVDVTGQTAKCVNDKGGTYEIERIDLPTSDEATE